MHRPQEVGNEELTIHLCGPAERAEQARLFNQCFKKSLEPEALAWRYDRNPHGRSVSFVSRPPGGEGISGYACNPRLALPGGVEQHMAPIGETGDVMTHPAWRKRGIFSGLDQACMRETARLGWPLVFGLPNRRSAHIFVQLGWERIGTIRPFTHVLRADAAARALRLAEGRLAALATPLAAHAGRRARRRLARQAGAYELRALTSFPPEVVELSRQVEARHSLMVRRDAAYLDWRFLHNTARLHEAFGLFDAEGRMAGYVVVQLPRAGGSLGYLVDILAPTPAAQAAALAAGLARLDEAGASAVQATAIEGTWWERTLLAAGFRRPKAENHLIVILYVHQPEHPLVSAARDVSRWYLTDGDRDDETMG